jgi:acetoin utilization deacetylase AcuC-like enzyme
MKIPIYFNEKMIANVILESPSPRKPLEIFNEWCKKYYNQIEIFDYPPFEKEDFYLAHAPKHVNDILNLKKINGFANKNKAIADSLYWTSSSFYHAAVHCLKSKVAVSPTSGFHHAGYDSAWGFCTFNGLFISAVKMLKENLVKKIGILDFDYHQGDGSENIMNKLRLYNQIIHITGKSSYPREKEKFFELIPYMFDLLKNVDIIFYQAGADQHINDPLGGFLTSEELRYRDNLVLNFAKKSNIPIVWNLAGGYQEDISNNNRSIQKVLDIHSATLEETIKIFNV